MLVMPDGVIGLLDFGMVGRIDERLQENIGEMLVALSSLDAEHMTAMIVRVGAPPPDLDRAALSLDVADFLSYYASQSLDRFDLSGALNEMIEHIRRYHIMLPARIAMLLKALVTLEGTARLVSPKFSLVEMMQPYRSKMLWRRFSPRRQVRKLRRLFSELEHLVDILPRRHRRHPRTDAERQVRHPPRPSRPGAVGQPAGAGHVGQRAVRRLGACC